MTVDLAAQLIAQQYGSDEVQEVVNKKSTEKQERVFASSASKRVTCTPEEAKKLFKAANIEYSPGMENRILERTLTDETVDRYGDIVKATGGDFTNYKKNPTLLAFHNSRTFPIGAVIKLQREGTATVGWLYFMDNNLDPTGVADAAFRMAAAGILKGGSIGFIPKEVEEPDEKKRQKLGMGKWGVIFTKWELIEFSVCPVPANPNALSFGEMRNKDVYGLATARGLLDIYAEETAAKIIDVLELDAFGELITNDEDYEIVNEELTEKPYANEHAARLRSPGSFNPETFRRKKDGTIYGSKKVPGTAAVIWGKLKGKDKPADNPIPQAIRFPTKDWTADEAKKWLKDNGIKYIKFEPASKDAEGEEPPAEPTALLEQKEPLEVKLSSEVMESITVLTNKATLLVEKLDLLMDALKAKSTDHGLPGDPNTELYQDILEHKDSLQASVASIGNEG